MAWDPALYSAFVQPRLRPALDLIGRIETGAPAHVVDLGCGTGNVTRLLKQRWPGAAVIGVDSSPEMLETARAGGGGVAYTLADMGSWRAAGPVDVLFSNAALHWLGDHATLFPRLLGMVAPGGVLAVQMPHNHYAASHALMAEAAAAGPWRDLLGPLAGRFPVAGPAFYYDLLTPLAASLDIWETEYLHVLDGDNPVVAWTMGTALRPALAALEDRPEWRDAFLADYSRRIRAAYPPQADGRTLLPFRRLFMVVRTA
ncbi:methyltransferase domain-containing protein [Magnetospirillum sp. SS-4]|uniref:methyltransferase domain-containing protein n=1 Tax=Magnetospirillum sp. SS-4 TaxID=2681465 RepID=UPI0013819D31|nr:methyltransferase domain-containing protein [Magnetospirillum sp. SS-4]CAA7612975.1 Trans-aconitate 2-methyltransferase [Magnetospirillum sp. SS-4]